jgi:hypothetical protein
MIDFRENDCSDADFLFDLCVVDDAQIPSYVACADFQQSV